MSFYAVLAVTAALVIYAVIVCNGLRVLKHRLSKAWGNIEVLLDQRHDELSKLVEVCRQHPQFGAETVERIIAARAGAKAALDKGDVKGVGAAENHLRTGLGSVMATVETYPELRADSSLQSLLGRIAALENAIADHRDLYNECVNENNVRIERLPGVFVARLAGCRTAELLEFDAGESRDVDVRGLFKEFSTKRLERYR